jgi:hypothetical protein
MYVAALALDDAGDVSDLYHARLLQALAAATKTATQPSKVPNTIVDLPLSQLRMQEY